MNQQQTAMQQALEALEAANDCSVWPNTLKKAAQIPEAITALRAALEAQQEPVLYVSPKQLADGRIARMEEPRDKSGVYLPVRKTPAGLFTMPLYAHPPAQPAKVEAQQEPPFGWAIVCNNGTRADFRSRVGNFFGAAVEHEPFGPEDLQRRDREWPGLAPHRLVTLYAHPPAQPQGWVLVPARLLQKAADVLEEATTYTGSESWSPSMTDELLALRQEMLAARPQPKETT